jgi:hypothetical protein
MMPPAGGIGYLIKCKSNRSDATFFIDKKHLVDAFERCLANICALRRNQP